MLVIHEVLDNKIIYDGLVLPVWNQTISNIVGKYRHKYDAKLYSEFK